MVLTLVVLVCGCQRQAEAPLAAEAPRPTPSPAPNIVGTPQPKLRSIKLWLGPQEITVEQAMTEEEIRAGMMFRKDMAENEGMLFIFGAPMQASFWMRNTLIPLSCAYIDPEGVILETRDMKPLDETPIEAKTDRVQYVLEVKQGWFERNKVTSGMLVRTERGSLRETYIGR